MNDADIDDAITQVKERIAEADEALLDLFKEFDDGKWTPGEVVEWQVDLRMAAAEVALHKDRLRMLMEEA